MWTTIGIVIIVLLVMALEAFSWFIEDEELLLGSAVINVILGLLGFVFGLSKNSPIMLISVLILVGIFKAIAMDEKCTAKDLLIRMINKYVNFRKDED